MGKPSVKAIVRKWAEKIYEIIKKEKRQFYRIGEQISPPVDRSLEDVPAEDISIEMQYLQKKNQSEIFGNYTNKSNIDIKGKPGELK